MHLVIEYKKIGFNQSHLMGLEKSHNSEQLKLKLDVIRSSMPKEMVKFANVYLMPIMLNYYKREILILIFFKKFHIIYLYRLTFCH